MAHHMTHPMTRPGHAQAKAGWLAARLAEHRKTAGTVIHGDYKNANVFFGKRFARGQGGPTPAGTATAMSDGMSHGMSMIDWQWTGTLRFGFGVDCGCALGYAFGGVPVLYALSLAGAVTVL